MLVIVVQEAEPSLGLPEALLAALLRAQVQEVLLHASYISVSMSLIHELHMILDV